MSLPFQLDPAEARVLGALMEKESTTPEYYPLSLNALVAACNQKSNRFPVMTLTEDDVLNSIERLRTHGFSAVIVGNGRVNKYAQRVTERLNLGRRESALLCTLLVRGAQTTGELRDRTERMYHFEDLDEVESCLHHLAAYESGALVCKLDRQPGQKEARYTHLLSGAPAQTEQHHAPDSTQDAALSASLEIEVRALRDRLDDLERQFAEFKRLFQ